MASGVSVAILMVRVVGVVEEGREDGEEVRNKIEIEIESKSDR